MKVICRKMDLSRNGIFYYLSGVYFPFGLDRANGIEKE